VFSIITVYRSLSGNFIRFLQTIDAVLQSLSSPSLGIIICGDININYLEVNEQRKHLDNPLLLYNLIGIVDFPTRLTNKSTTAIDNVFIGVSGFHNYMVTPFPNGLSDDTQILAFRALSPGQSPGTKFVRKVDQQTISDFIFALSNESWSNIFNTEDVNLMYNSFLNTYLRLFYASFPLTRVTSQNKCNRWITVGMQTSRKHKRELFLLNRSLNNPVLKRYYTTYCNTLAKVIGEAKRMTFSTRISKSHNITKTTWNIINELLGKQHSSNDIQKLNS
jgi:hypothetical protein